MPTAAHFEATYGARKGTPSSPATDETLTILPAARRRLGIADAGAH